MLIKADISHFHEEFLSLKNFWKDLITFQQVWGKNFLYVMYSWRVYFIFFLFHVSGIFCVCHSKTFQFLLHQPNGLCCKLQSPEQLVKCQKLVRLYLLSLFKFVPWRGRVWFCLWTWPVFVWGEIGSTKWIDIWLELK